MIRKFTTPQDALEGMPEPPIPEAANSGIEPRFEPGRRRAFGSVPRLLGETALGLPDYRQLPTELVMEVGVNSLRQSLTPNFTSARQREHHYVVSGLALNALEYKTIVRAHETGYMERAADATTESANAGMTSPLRMHEKQLKGRRELLKSKGERHGKILKSLEAETENLEVLRNLAYTPGYARTTELDIRNRASQAWNLTFRNLLIVVGRQRDWTIEQAAAAEQAVASRLSTGPQQERMRYWSEMIGLSLDYNHMKHALFSQRKHKIATSYIASVAELAAFYAEHELQPLS